MSLFIFIVVVIFIACGYALILRPILSRMPQYQKFYNEADGFWAKVWVYIGKSVTLIWHYILGGASVSLVMLDPIAKALGDPDFKTQVTQFVNDHLGSNPTALGWILFVISGLTLLARMRSLMQG
jgi:hypothetical protein